jgi:lipopolysaccharide export system protein LptA
MLKPFINQSLKLCLLALAAVCTASHASKEDFSKTIEIASQYQHGDGIARKSFYRGNVLITQGSLVVKADEMEIDGSKGEGKEVFVALGKPAEYSQQQEDGSIVTAKAERIEYQRETRTLSLQGNAEIVQNSSSVKGNSIVFNMQLEQVMAQGQDQEDGRVITILQPESASKQKQEVQP